MSNLAMTYSHLNRLEDAEDMTKQSYKKHKKALGSRESTRAVDHVPIGVDLGNAGLVQKSHFTDDICLEDFGDWIGCG